MPNLSKEEQEAIVERAIQKWMDSKFSAFGKGIVIIVLIGGFGALCRWLFLHGWNPQ